MQLLQRSPEPRHPYPTPSSVSTGEPPLALARKYTLVFTSLPLLALGRHLLRSTPTPPLSCPRTQPTPALLARHVVSPKPGILTFTRTRAPALLLPIPPKPLPPPARHAPARPAVSSSAPQRAVREVCEYEARHGREHEQRAHQREDVPPAAAVLAARPVGGVQVLALKAVVGGEVGLTPVLCAAGGCSDVTSVASRLLVHGG